MNLVFALVIMAGSYAAGFVVNGKKACHHAITAIPIGHRPVVKVALIYEDAANELSIR